MKTKIMLNTLKYDTLQTAAIFVFMLLTGLATYYINLRMVMDNARQSRLAAGAKTKTQVYGWAVAHPYTTRL